MLTFPVRKSFVELRKLISLQLEIIEVINYLICLDIDINYL